MKQLARATALLAVSVPLLAGVARGQASPPIENLPLPAKDVGFDQNIGQYVPLDATFKDDDGKDVRLGDYFGSKPVVLSLAYDTCPMLCNLSVEGLARSLRGMNLDAGRDFTVVTISFDPRDTPALSHAKRIAAMDRYGRPQSEGAWRFLTGDEAQIKRVTNAVGFRYTWDEGAKQYAHPAGIVVLTPEGQIARYLFGIEYAAKDLRLSMVEASKGHLGNAVDQLLLLCFHYDPKVGKYGPFAIGAMRTGGLLTLVAVMGLVLLMNRRNGKHSGAIAHARKGSS